ncbi:MAG: TatD family hydrolase [Pseudomonadales bacterium]|nr:TatD family hydrolase [Pseudomonadales bacterium]
MIIDSHCHLNLLDLVPFEGSLEAALQDSRDRGVGAFICIGVDLETQPAVMAIAEAHQDVYATVGIHPNHVVEHIDFEQLRHYATQRHVVAIGETGLDYHYTPESAVLQQASLEQHIQLAKDLDLPLVIHTREARRDTLDLLSQAGPRAGVMHCFTEDWETAKRALDLGFYISFSGVLTFKNAQALREVAAQVPLDRLMVETDSPWLAPVPHRGRSNRPAYVIEVARVLAELRGVSLEEMTTITRANTRSLFKLP